MEYYNSKTQKGFTLLELLIVIGIVAILSVALVFVLNPAEALKKSRDSQRISDLTTLKKAIEIYKTNIASPKLAGADNEGCKGTALSTGWQPATDHIYYSLPSDVGNISTMTLDGATFTTGGGPVQVTKANAGRTDGNGWIPINFSALPGGSPISNLPVDPTNRVTDPTTPTSTDLVYRYICSEKDLTYEINTTLESEAYTTTDNKASKDGGNSDSYYEVGTSLALMSVESPPDPCLGKSIGQACTGGAIYTGTFNPLDGGGVKKYMTTPADAGTKAWAISTTDTWALSTTDGVANTNKIEAKGSTYAAGYYCGTLTVHGYSDWFLPAVGELNLLYINKTAIGGFNISGSWPASYYWTSTEALSIYASFQGFADGNQYEGNAKSGTLSVRCVRRY